MWCRRVRRLLVPLADGRLEMGARRVVEAHLAGCAPCRNDLAATRRIVEALTGFDAVPPLPAGLEAATMRRVRALPVDDAGQRLARAGGLSWRAVAWPVAASVAAGAVLVWWTAASRPGGMSVVRSAPPTEVLGDLELFIDMPILRNLEKLEHFEAIRTSGLPAGRRESGDGGSREG